MESNGTQLKQSPVVLFAQISPTHSAHLTTEIILPFLLIKDIGIPLRNPLTDAVVAFYTYVCTTIEKRLVKKSHGKRRTKQLTVECLYVWAYNKKGEKSKRHRPQIFQPLECVFVSVSKRLHVTRTPKYMLRDLPIYPSIQSVVILTCRLSVFWLFKRARNIQIMPSPICWFGEINENLPLLWLSIAVWVLLHSFRTTDAPLCRRNSCMREC